MVKKNVRKKSWTQAIRNNQKNIEILLKRLQLKGYYLMNYNS